MSVVGTEGKKRQAAIAGRARRVGWPVETADGNQKGWLYRVTRPDGVRVQIHSSPSDVNWERTVLRRLNGRDGAFDQAEADQRLNEEIERKDRLAADARRNAADLKRAEAEAAARAHVLDVAAGPYAPAKEFDPQWILTPHEFMECRRGIMTPTLARQVLDKMNERNRKYRPERKDYFVKVIKRGDWGVTHQGGAIDSDGNLIDAQHRLEACAELGVPIEIYMTVGCPPENFRKVDAPLIRRARDAAYVRGERDVVPLTAAARLVLGFDAFGSELHLKLTRAGFTIDEIDQAVVEYGDPLRDAVAEAKHIRKEIRIQSGALATSRFLIGRVVGHDDDRVRAFFEDLKYGENLRKTDPMWLLRRYYNTGEGSQGRQEVLVALALIIKTWNARVAGRKPQHLSWRSNEWFPATIIDPGPIVDPTVRAIRQYDRGAAEVGAL